MENLKLGIFGFGCVGQGLYKVLHQTKGVKAEIKKFCIKHPDKKRSLPAEFFTTDKYVLLDDPEINIIVELIDDADAAFVLVKEAFERGKAVVSANKKMIAEHLSELLVLQEKHKVPFLYEGSCCASIPIIRNLEEYYDNDLLTSIEGIFNGSSNFILSKMFNEEREYDDVLAEAQALGFAESDPTLDVEGIDPKYKLCIILFHAFGLVVDPADVFSLGISKVSKFDIDFARQRGLVIKPVARCRRDDLGIHAFVAPEFVAADNDLFNTHNEFNAVILEGAFSEKQFLKGKGAGDKPTGSAVLSDISALSYGYKYEYKKHRNNGHLSLDKSALLKVYVRYQGETPLLNDFEKIEEKYLSGNGSYLVGTIRQQKLESATWLESAEVNVILMNS